MSQPANPLSAAEPWNLVANNYAETTMLVFEEFADEAIAAVKLKPHSTVLDVVGSSCLKGVFINNSRAVGRTAEVNGLHQVDEVERELPAGSRYLPMADESNVLSKRMRAECCVMTFERTAIL